MKTTWMPCVGVTLAVLVLGATLAHAQGTQLLVSNVQAQQRPFTATWEITYDLETVGDISVTVSLYLSTNSGASYPDLCATVSGDVGAGVLPGTGKSIVWDAGADFPGLSSATCRLRVTADDGQSEVPAGFVVIAPGTFMMGSPTTEPGRVVDETRHQVTLTRGFYMQATEVTNQRYRDMVQWAYDNGYVTATSASVRDALDGSTQELLNLGGYREISFSGGRFTVEEGDANHPVLDVTWYGSVAYCDWLSLQQGLPRAYNHSTWQCNAGNPYTATGYRLPTEAEWEYACRAGTQTPFSTGYCLDAGTEANYDGEYPYTGCPVGPLLDWTAPAGSYPANAFGLYDMHGNLWEWCNDWWGSYGGTVTDPVGPGAGSYRLVRGGSWGNTAQYCRSASRYLRYPYLSSQSLGFRPVRSTDSVVPQTGTIIINPEPDGINAPWQVTGPNAFSWSAAGDTTLTNMTAGSYTLTWGTVPGWTTPNPAARTQTLVAGGVETFTGVYIEDVEVPVGFVSIPPGTFMMGSPTTESGRDTIETKHQVTLTHGIDVQITEVTNQQYRDMAQWAYDNGYVTATSASVRDALDGSTQELLDLDVYCEISFIGGTFTVDAGREGHPVLDVSWYGSVAYCDWLSLQQGLPRAYNHSTWQCNAGDPYTAPGYRLPTEAEWEYACRAGTQTPFNTGSCLDADTEAHYNGLSPYTGCPAGPYFGATVRVGSYPANAFGLYDMHGNLYEWCNDWHGPYGGTVMDPVGAGAGSFRTVRGGFWGYGAEYCRSAFRFYHPPYSSYDFIGFRPVRSIN